MVKFIINKSRIKVSLVEKDISECACITVVIERVMNKKRVVHRDQSQLLTTELCMLVEPQTITNTFIL